VFKRFSSTVRKEKEMPIFIKTSEYTNDKKLEVDVRRLANMNLSTFRYIELRGNIDAPNEFSDISFLNLFPKLESINIDRAAINPFPAIPSLSRLTELSIKGTDVNAIDLISRCPNLKKLSLDDSNACNGGILPRLDVFRRIESLNIWHEDLENISAISLCYSSLKSLILNYNSRLTDISPLNTLFLLERLEMHENDELVDITPLSRLGNLKYLDIKENRKLCDISPLSNLWQLEYLDIRGTSIKNYSPVLSLRGLRNLRVGEYSLRAKPFPRRIIRKIKAKLPYCGLVINYDINEKNILKFIDDLADSINIDML